jgi:hypothetical protein
VVDDEVEYAFDYLDWEVFDRIGEASGVLLPQQIYQLMVTSDEGGLFGMVSERKLCNVQGAYREVFRLTAGLSISILLSGWLMLWSSAMALAFD